MMARRSILLVSMVLVFAAVWYFLREPDGTPVAAATAEDVVTPPASAVRVAESPAPATAATAELTIEQLVALTNSPDARLRAAAVTALAKAPREQALPALVHVLQYGEPGVDRPLALRSLRELALAQGDADGAVRSALREVIYHGDDEALQAEAQEALSVVENSQSR